MINAESLGSLGQELNVSQYNNQIQDLDIIDIAIQPTRSSSTKKRHGSASGGASTPKKGRSIIVINS